MPTLLETVKDGTDVVRTDLVMTITEASPILQLVNFRPIDGNAYTYPIEVSLPTVATRNIGGTYTANSGVITNQTERLIIVGGEVRIDNFEVKTGGQKRDIKARHYRAKARALAIWFSEMFFEGDADANPMTLDGIRRRIAGTSQVVNLTTGGVTLTLDAIDQLVDTVVGSGAGNTHLFMNKTLRRKITALARDHSGTTLLGTGEDMLGKQITTYNGLPIHVIEREDNASTFLDFDEDDGSSNLDTASIYCVRFGDDYVQGLQGSGSLLTVKDFGEMEERPQHMGRIEAYWGLAMHHPRSAARLTRINNA